MFTNGINNIIKALAQKLNLTNFSFVNWESWLSDFATFSMIIVTIIFLVILFYVGHYFSLSEKVNIFYVHLNELHVFFATKFLEV